MPAPFTPRVDVKDIAETLRALDRELGDNGKVYRATIRQIKKAGDQAVNRARGYLPQERDLPSGFTHKNVRGWAVSRVQGRDRAFPRYDRVAATGSIRVISARERSVRTDYGWRAGKMYGIAIEMRDPAGSIYDVAGNAKSKRQLRNRTPQGQRFIDQLKTAWIGDPKWNFRVLLPAVVDTRPEIIKDIRRILDGARLRLDAERDITWSTIR